MWPVDIQGHAVGAGIQTLRFKAGKPCGEGGFEILHVGRASRHAGKAPKNLLLDGRGSSQTPHFREAVVAHGRICRAPTNRVL